MMKPHNLFQFLAVCSLTVAVASAQAGAVDALKQFNNDADGISGSFTQTVQSKKKPKPRTARSKSCARASSNGNTLCPTNRLLSATVKPFGSTMLIWHK
ncbi:LolA protein [Neisseria gonorrhoeae]|uniref:LolA protein n=1 Tax=Neisseria gonorrhoeae TaxID=485 RepID=A0A378W0C5_NEIGO|nr:LolA protein [Neisseria gonorrhoeae]